MTTNQAWSVPDVAPCEPPATQRHLALLDEPARRAVELHFIHDLDITEIAEHLDASPAAVTDMINQALIHLRSTM